ncbi:GAF and ANTAR domain-containing protein [Actinopolymorpha sp. B11F2]|uniref:GAF and ANTAR domain-containing protein n=1 Tax=Actinopolymorpha sp. B11F2 TaxID=3160862 RepID=UPI0032E481CF
MAIEWQHHTDQRDEISSTLLGSVQTLLVTGPHVEAYLNKVAWLAANVVQPPASCGITAHYDGRPGTVAASDQRAPLLDEKQFAVDEGPCLQTLRTGEIVDVSDLQVDDRWKRYREQALRLGVRCSLSFPLNNVDGQTVGALNMYGYDRPHAFNGIERRLAEMYVVQASTALGLAMRRTGKADVTAQLAQTLTSRTFIDQALGILMAKRGCNADEAFNVLRKRSQSSKRPLREVAAELIAQVSGTAPIPPQPFEPRSAEHDPGTSR